MCGILYARVRQTQGDHFSKIFQEAIQLMDYRGKDNIGYHQQNNHYFGHARLSILDLSTRSNQPMITKNHIFLFKGEIYNYKHLVNDAHSDTLAIGDMLENDIDIVTQLCGMYVLLIYHRKDQSLRILRDFYGEKPLYYYHDKEIFIASSTIKAINHILFRAFKVKPTINHYSFYEYLLCGYVREPRTIYENIFMLSSGHMLHVSPKGQLKIENEVKKILKQTPFNSAEHAHSALETTDVKPALLLSSGVDSTYLLSLMQKTSLHFNVFTYKALNKALDESRQATDNFKKICASSSAKSEIQVLENHHNLVQLYQDFPRFLEQPTSDGMNLYNILMMMRRLSHDLKLIILGTGGDELYGGYHSFTNLKKYRWLVKCYPFIKKLIPVTYQRFFTMDRRKTLEITNYYFFYRTCHKLLPHVNKEIVEALVQEFIAEMQKYQWEEEPNAYYQLRTYESFDYMRNQLLRDADNISLFCGFEARNPLLSIPAYHQKLDYKQAMKNELRNKYQIMFKRKKGFTFYSADQALFAFLKDQILAYQKEYRVVPKSLIDSVLYQEKFDFSLAKKLYTLLAWLHANNIDHTQLQSVYSTVRTLQ